MDAGVAPESIQCERRVSGACTAGVEQVLADIERRPMRENLRFRGGKRHMRPFFGCECRALLPGILERLRGALGQRFRAYRLQTHLAKALDQIRVVSRFLDPRSDPGPPILVHVAARFFQRPLRNADEQVGQHQLRDKRA